MPNFNILLHEVLERFHWGRLPVSRFRLFANKIKFVDGERVFKCSKEDVTHVFFDSLNLQPKFYLNRPHALDDVVITDENVPGKKYMYRLTSFVKDNCKALPVLLQYDMVNNFKGQIEI